jgi:hypothetical protein
MTGRAFAPWIEPAEMPEWCHRRPGARIPWAGIAGGAALWAALAALVWWW